MKILGIDPGLNNTGYGLIDASGGRLRLIEAGIIHSKASQSLEKRLVELSSGLEEVIRDLHPDVCSVEEIYSHYSHPKTAVIMGHARGVCFLVAGIANIPVYSYSATRIKKSLTGNGRATKEQIASMVRRTVRCSEDEVKSDVTDAVAAALCHLNAMSHASFV